jgi:hypothetical protein
MGSADGLPTEVFVLAMVGVGYVDLSFKEELPKMRDDEGGFVRSLEEGAKLHCLLSILPRLIIVLLAFVGFCLWNSSTRSSVCTWSAGSQVLWACGYPSHFRKYSRRPLPRPFRRESNTCSTSYSSSPSIMSGAGSVKAHPFSSVSLYGDRRDAWKTGWTRFWRH